MSEDAARDAEASWVVADELKAERDRAVALLKKLAARHAQHGICISCGKGPRVAVTLTGQCRSCARSQEGDELRAIIGSVA